MSCVIRDDKTQRRIMKYVFTVMLALAMHCLAFSTPAADFRAGTDAELNISSAHYTYKSFLASGEDDISSSFVQCAPKPAGSLNLTFDLGPILKSTPLLCVGVGTDIGNNKIRWTVNQTVNEYRTSGTTQIYIKTITGTLTALLTPVPPQVSQVCGRIYNLKTESIDGDAGNNLHVDARVSIFPATMDVSAINYHGFAGINTLPAELPIAPLKTVADDTQETLTGKIVTSGSGQFANRLYISDANGTSGIAVIGSGLAVDTGDKIDVTGTLTTVNDERELTGTKMIIHKGPFTLPVPKGMMGSALGGSALGYCPGIPGALGPSNVGVLAKTWGNVSYSSSDPAAMYVDDGARVTDGSGHNGVCVRLDELAAGNTIVAPPQGSFVVVTGLVSTTTVNGVTCRAIRPRKQSDIVILR
jgi:hypothetical protein